MSASSEWVPVALADELGPGEGKTVTARARRFALFNDGGAWFALDDTCPHQGASLGEGTLHEGRVICPWHAWVFELRSGRCPRDSHVGVSTYRARCADGRVEIELPLGGTAEGPA